MDFGLNLGDITASGAPPGPVPVEITESREVNFKDREDGEGIRGEYLGNSFKRKGVLAAILNSESAWGLSKLKKSGFSVPMKTGEICPSFAKNSYSSPARLYRSIIPFTQAETSGSQGQGLGGWGFSSIVEGLSSMHQVLGSSPSIQTDHPHQ